MASCDVQIAEMLVITYAYFLDWETKFIVAGKVFETHTKVVCGIAYRS